MNDLRAAIATLALIVLAATFAAPATAQDAYLELYARYSRIRSYGEAVVLPADRGAIALFTVRVPNSRLVFVRDREAPGSGNFLARVEVTVQVRQGDRLVAERIWQTTHAAATYDRSVSRDEDLEASIPLALDPGDYRYRILVRDLNAEDLLIPAPPAPLHVPDFSADAVGMPFTVLGDASAGNRVRLANLGGDVPFAEPARWLVPIGVTDARNRELRYVIWRLPRNERPARRSRASLPRRQNDPPEWGPVQDRKVDLGGAERLAEGSIPSTRWQPFTADALALEPVAMAEIHSAGTTSRTYLAPVPLDDVGDRWGTYAIEVVLSGGGDDVRSVRRFAFHWKDMPIALHDAETAIRMLSFIERPERIREMLRRPRDEREQVLIAYWKERDPTPDTPFNELMAEYYRRIDHAAMEFRTGGGVLPNGLRTDQARIYIVHGPPKGIERTFPPLGGVEETWTYEGGRRFVFSASNSLEPLALQEAE